MSKTVAEGVTTPLADGSECISGIGLLGDCVQPYLTRDIRANSEYLSGSSWQSEGRGCASDQNCCCEISETAADLAGAVAFIRPSGFVNEQHVRKTHKDSGVGCTHQSPRRTTSVKRDATRSNKNIKSSTQQQYSFVDSVTDNHADSETFGNGLFESSLTVSTTESQLVVDDCPTVEPICSTYRSTSCGELGSVRHERSPSKGRKTLRNKDALYYCSANCILAETEILSAERTNVPLSDAQKLTETRCSKNMAAAEQHKDKDDDDRRNAASSSAMEQSRPHRWWHGIATMLGFTNQVPEKVQKTDRSSTGQREDDRAEEQRAESKKSVTIVSKHSITVTSKHSVTYRRLLKRKYYKNLLVISIAYFFVLSAYLALRNLQSSINAAGGLGVYSLSALYCSLVVGSLFSTTIVQRLRPKRCMIVSLSLFIVYCAANFYPRFYTMIPVCIVLGFWMGPLWTSEATYVTTIAVSYARGFGKEIAHVTSQFQGIYYVFFQSSQISGGLISSLLLSGHKAEPRGKTLSTASYNDSLLYLPQQTRNSTVQLCGSKYCPSSDGQGQHKASIDKGTFYALMGTFTACTVIGLLIVIFLLDPLEGVMKKSDAKLSQQMTAVFRFFLQRRARCAIGLSFYSLLEIAFMFGEFTKAYVTCVLGIDFVGYVMLTMAVCTGLSALVSGQVQQYVGRIPLIATALCIHFTLLLVLYFWSPTKQTLYVFFILVAIWGIADGMLMTQIISLFGTLFHSNAESAFAAHKMCQALSAFAMFVTAPYLCTEVKIFIVMTVLLLAVAGYATLEVMLEVQARQEIAAAEAAAAAAALERDEYVISVDDETRL